VDFLPDPTFIIDTKKRVIAWNAAMERFTAIKKDQMLGRGGYAFAIPLYDRQRPALIDLIDADIKEISRHYTLIHNNGDSLEAEIFVPRLDQRNGAVFSVRAAKLNDTTGFPTGTIETIRDITDEHPGSVKTGGRTGVPGQVSGSGDTTPQKLHPARDEHIPPMISLLYLSNALKLAHDGIGILDRSARCVWVNNALVDLLGAGYSTAIIGKSLTNFITTEQRKMTTDLLLSIPRSGPVSFNISIITPSGTTPVGASVSQISDEAGELLGFMVILRDRRKDWPAVQAGSDTAEMSDSK
jgi:PAS domain S-box-containing protein